MLEYPLAAATIVSLTMLYKYIFFLSYKSLNKGVLGLLETGKCFLLIIIDICAYPVVASHVESQTNYESNYLNYKVALMCDVKCDA